jgi:hypothetical protein
MSLSSTLKSKYVLNDSDCTRIVQEIKEQYHPEGNNNTVSFVNVYPTRSELDSYRGFVIGGQLYHLVICVGRDGRTPYPFAIELCNTSLSSGVVYKEIEQVGTTGFTLDQIIEIGRLLTSGFKTYHHVFWNATLFVNSFLDIICGESFKRSRIDEDQKYVLFASLLFPSKRLDVNLKTHEEIVSDNVITSVASLDNNSNINEKWTCVLI